jgi:hypothetical protein
MTPAEALKKVSNIHGADAPDPDILANTSIEDQKKIFDDPALWNSASYAVETPEEIVEDVETPIESPIETSEPNPFSTWGIPDDTYKQYVESGVITDGKMRGKFGPDELSAYINQSENEQKLRGHLSNEVGDLRKEVDSKEKEIQTVKEYNKQLLESDHLKSTLSRIEVDVKRGMKQMYLDFDSPLPGLDEAQDLWFKDKVNDLTFQDREMSKAFKRAKINPPKSEDDWEDLKRERIDIYDDFVRLRDNIYESEAEKLYLQGAIAKEYKDIKKSAYYDAAQVLYNNLTEEGITVPEKNSDMENLIVDGINFLNKELTQAEQEGRQPDSRYFYLHPTTGQPIPRAESLDLYLRLNRKDVLKSIPTWTEKEPEVTDTPDQNYYKDVYDKLVSSLQLSFSKNGLEITADDPLIAEGINHLIANKDNPLYWINGQPKEDALVVYQRLEKPTLISDVLEQARRAQINTERADETKKLQAEWSKRVAQQNDTTPSIASSVSQSSPGQTIPLVSPDIYRNAKEMMRLSKKMGITPMELYDQQKARILQLPEASQQQYGF